MGIVEGPSAPVFHRVDPWWICGLCPPGLFCGPTADRGISPRPEGMV